MKIRENYSLTKIKIPDKFMKTLPSERKIEEKKKVLVNNNTRKISIVINHKRELTDGFATYLAAGILKIEHLNVIQTNVWEEFNIKNNTKTTFVYGKHPNSVIDKEYVWRVPISKEITLGNIRKGDNLMVATKFGPAPIVVTKIERKQYSPITGKIKTVIGRIEK